MSRFSSLLIALLLLSADAVRARGDEPGAQDSPRGPRITLANGDYVTGKLVDSERANQLCWQGDGLTEKLVFPMAAVSSVHFPSPPEQGEASGDFSFELVGGDSLTGSLVSLSADAVELNSASLGTLRINRDQLRRIVRYNHQGETIYSGPNGLTGWTSPKSDHPWRDEGGQLAAAAPGEISFADVKVPAKASVEIEASWQHKASFSIHVGSEWHMRDEIVDGFGRVIGREVQVKRTKTEKPSSLFSLETWGDWVVLVRETEKRADVSPVVRLTPGPGRIHLRLLFDQSAGRVAVYSADGELLGEASAPDDQKLARGGLRLENKSGDLRVEYLAIHGWFGDKPTAVNAERSYLQTSKGEVHYSDSLAYDAEAQEFVVAESEKTAATEPADDEARNDAPSEPKRESLAAPPRIPLADVTTLSFQPSGTAQQQPIRVASYDGSRVSGELAGVTNGKLLLRRPGIEAPLELPVDRLRMIASLSSKMPQPDAEGRAGRLEGDGLRLHGWLVDSAANESAAASSCLHWRSLASMNSSPLSKDFSGSVVYRDPPQPAKKVALNQARAAAVRLQARAVVRAKPAGIAAVLQAVGAGGPINDKPVLTNNGTVSDKQLLWLRAGDRLPCTIESIDDRGVTFKSSAVAATFLPHDAIKAWERKGGRPPRPIDPEKRERLLTLPRMQRANPPTHLIESTTGDYLRGQLEELNAKTLQMSVRLETKKIAFDDVASIVWFDPLKPAQEKDQDDGNAKNAAAAGERPVPADKAPADRQVAAIDLAKSMQAVRADGVRLTFEPHSVAEGVIDGDSRLLGKCHVDVREVDQLLLGNAIGEAAEELAYHQWRLKPAADPQFVNEGSEPGSASAPQGALADKPAPDFRLDLLAEGKQFNLGEQRGKVVVLDFWASWCGPCMQSLPKLQKLAKELENQDVRFVAVNMQEDRATVADALERLDIDLEVALDVDGATGEKYAVSAIPHTVVIDRNGVVAASLIGGGPDVEQQLRDAIAKSLESPTN